MDRCGYELILDTGKFWASRLEEGQDGKLHINDVVGPDEYKEHVDDNAFTNYMAAWNIRKALEYSRMLKANRPDLYQALDAKLGLTALEPQWRQALPHLSAPAPEDLVIPQDRTYLTLKDIDLTKYKNQQNVGSIYRDYNQEQITHMQVSKQARHPDHVPAAGGRVSAHRSSGPTGAIMSPAPSTTPPCPPTASWPTTWATGIWPTACSAARRPSTLAPT